MDTQKALELTKPEEILRAVHEAEARNCEQWVIRRLWDNYYKATEKAH
jgi:hypothetical protein